MNLTDFSEMLDIELVYEKLFYCSAFNILIGTPESTPSSFGTSIIAVGPGQEHKLLVTPTFIRSHVGVTFKINSLYIIDIIQC